MSTDSGMCLPEGWEFNPQVWVQFVSSPCAWSVLSWFLHSLITASSANCELYSKLAVDVCVRACVHSCVVVLLLICLMAVHSLALLPRMNE